MVASGSLRSSAAAARHRKVRAASSSIACRRRRNVQAGIRRGVFQTPCDPSCKRAPCRSAVCAPPSEQAVMLRRPPSRPAIAILKADALLASRTGCTGTPGVLENDRTGRLAFQHLALVGAEKTRPASASMTRVEMRRGPSPRRCAHLRTSSRWPPGAGDELSSGRLST